MSCSSKSFSNRTVSSRRRKTSTGTALIEFALSFFVMWAMITGVYGFGYAFYIYNRMLTAVADAASMGAKMDYDTSDNTSYLTSLKNMVVYGDTIAGTNPIVPGLTTSNVTVTVGTDGNQFPRDITVAIASYSIDGLVQRINL
ncbi:MAG: TadE/TadG family type IV pilus assembly protein, partial [Acidobacteriota bacterium]